MKENIIGKVSYSYTQLVAFQRASVLLSPSPMDSWFAPHSKVILFYFDLDVVLWSVLLEALVDMVCTFITAQMTNPTYLHGMRLTHSRFLLEFDWSTLMGFSGTIVPTRKTMARAKISKSLCARACLKQRIPVISLWKHNVTLLF